MVTNTGTKAQTIIATRHGYNGATSGWLVVQPGESVRFTSKGYGDKWITCATCTSAPQGNVPTYGLTFPGEVRFEQISFSSSSGAQNLLGLE
jgi:hypothetical protein